jgi:hypothetical protein
MMYIKPSILVFGLTLAVAPSTSFAADDTDLAGLLPEDTLAVLHIRSLPALRATWEFNPLARTWAEPEVQAFIAPALEKFQEENSGGLIELVQAETGMTPDELLDLFPGEFAIAVPNLLSLLSEDDDQLPQLVILTQIGENPEPVEGLFNRLSEDEGDEIAEEEFQGETIRTVLLMDEEADAPEEAFSWAIFDGVLVMATTRPGVQQVIDNSKRGGAEESLVRMPGFQAIYRGDPEAHIAFYLNLANIVQHLLAQVKEIEAARAPDQPSPLAMVGMTPEGIMTSLGLDKLTTLYGAGVLGKDATLFTTGIKWTERPGIMRILAYGDSPAPRPGFIPDHWINVTSSRFSLSEMYTGLKEVLQTGSPGLAALLEMRVAEMNQAMGIDIERDLVGNFGDEIVQAEALADRSADAENVAPTDRLWAVSIKDADSARRVVDALMVMFPGIAQALQSREYLGETIHSFEPPVVSAGGPPSPGFAYAITRNQVFVTMGKPSMLETAVQGLDGASDSIWSNQRIAEALGALPPGESMISYQDTKRIVVTMFDLITRGEDWFGGEDADGVEGSRHLFDMDAKPSVDVLAQHWGLAVSAAYIEADGIRSIGRLNHGDAEDSE